MFCGEGHDQDLAGCFLWRLMRYSHNVSDQCISRNVLAGLQTRGFQVPGTETGRRHHTWAQWLGSRFCFLPADEHRPDAGEALTRSERRTGVCSSARLPAAAARRLHLTLCSTVACRSQVLSTECRWQIQMVPAACALCHGYVSATPLHVQRRPLAPYQVTAVTAATSCGPPACLETARQMQQCGRRLLTRKASSCEREREVFPVRQPHPG